MMWMVWILVCACRPTPSEKWSDERIVSRVMATFDANANGLLEAVEIEGRISPESALNLDKNGTLSQQELLKTIQSIAPSAFLNPPKQSDETQHAQEPAPLRAKGSLSRLELIRFLALECAQFAPEAPVPEEALMVSLATQGGPPFSQEIARLQGLLSRR